MLNALGSFSPFGEDLPLEKTYYLLMPNDAKREVNSKR
jgi:hypothetical protein